MLQIFHHINFVSLFMSSRLLISRQKEEIVGFIPVLGNPCLGLLVVALNHAQAVNYRDKTARIYPHYTQGREVPLSAASAKTLPGFITMTFWNPVGMVVDENAREFYPRFTADQLPSTESY